MKLEIDIEQETSTSLAHIIKFLSIQKNLKATTYGVALASKEPKAPAEESNGKADADEEPEAEVEAEADFSDKSMRMFVQGLGDANINALQAVVDNGGRLGYDDICTASERDDMRGAGGIVRRAKRILKDALLIWDEKREEYCIPKEAIKPLREALEYHKGE